MKINQNNNKKPFLQIFLKKGHKIKLRVFQRDRNF
jgi:hypothetical protein